MIPLTSEQITARRVELQTVEDQLRTLGRRRTVLRAEILSGYVQPDKKTDARQLSLPVEDKAALDEAASEAVAEVMAKQSKAPQSRAKNEKAPVEGPSEANVQRTVLRVMKPGAWMGVASILPAVNEATGATVETAEIVRCMQDLTNAGRVEDHPSAFSWRLVPEAPKATPAKKGKATPKKAVKPARKAAKKTTPKKVAATPPPPPTEKVGPVPQRWYEPLRTWLHERILWAGEEGASYLDLCDEISPTAFLFEEMGATLDLFLAVGLIEKQARPGRLRGRTVSWYVATTDEFGRSVDEVIFDEIAGTLADGPQTVDALVVSLNVTRPLMAHVLGEMERQHRVTRQGDLWRLATAQDRTLPILPDVEPAPAREEAAE